MGARRNSSQCHCGWLRRAANDPRSAVQFDRERNEYHLKLSSGSFLVIDYCLVCGGSAPNSNPRIQLHSIKPDERERLAQLTANLRTVDDVIKALGEPDLKQASQVIMVQGSRNARPHAAATYPALTYLHLSETADVRVTIEPGEHVSFSFRGKPVGEGRA